MSSPRLPAFALVPLLLLALAAGGLPGGNYAAYPGYYRAPAEVVFLEHSLLANGTVTNGSVPFRSVNFPSYWFNANTRQLNGAIDFPLNASLRLIFGDGLTLSGNFGGGTGNKLYGIYALPARAGKATIVTVDRWGDVGLYVDNRSVVLRPGQQYDYQEKEVLREGNGTVSVAYNHSYVNHGLIASDEIRPQYC